jgi:hypothetical protein
MGRGATATIERLAASLGKLDEVEPRFEAALDVPKGGVLLALPALLGCGLLRHSGKYFRLPTGFYGLKTIFLLLAFMALARLKSIEALRYYAPGEWGKLLGIDRAPEVRTLRVKLRTLAATSNACGLDADRHSVLPIVDHAGYLDALPKFVEDLSKQVLREKAANLLLQHCIADLKLQGAAAAIGYRF